MEKEKTVIREYEVYHRLMRDAQVYAGDSLGDGVDLNGEECQDNWRDFSGDPIVDVVFAKSECEAVELVAKDTGYHESNLYAVEHVVDVVFSVAGLFGDTDILKDSVLIQQSREFRLTGSSYDDGRLSGIEVTMPGSNRAFLGFDRMDNQWKVMMMAKEPFDEDRKICNLDLDRS